MFTAKYQRRTLLRNASLAALCAVVTGLVATTAQAGECPADKVATNAITEGPSEPIGVTDMVLNAIDLSKQAVKLDHRMFRLRRLEIAPGGVVPFHEHSDRPALIFMIKGTAIEYSSNCTVPIVHKTGEAAAESIGLSHWWRNDTNETVVLISADILNTKMEKGDVM